MGNSGFRQTHADGGLGGVSGVVSSLPAGYTLGEERRVDGNDYRLVYNNGNSQATVGNVVVNDGSGVGAYSCTISSTAGTIPPKAVGVVKHATLTTGTYGWVLTRGDAGKLIASNVSLATGALIEVKVNGVVGDTTVASGTAIGYNRGDSDGTATTDTLSGDFQVKFS